MITKTTSCPAAHPPAPPKKLSTAPAASTWPTRPSGGWTPDVSAETTTSSTSLALVPAASARWDWCMTPGELAAVRRRLEGFAAGVVAWVARRGQREEGAAHV